MKRTNLVVLGLLSEQPRYGYELNQEIERRNMRKWARVSYASLYNAISRLEKEGLIEGEEVRDKGTPPKTIYKITPNGISELSEMVKEVLSSDEIYYLDFNLGLDKITMLPREEALICLRERLRKREQDYQTLLDKMENKPDHPFGAWAIFEQYHILNQAELNWLRSLIKRVETAEWLTDVKNKETD